MRLLAYNTASFLRQDYTLYSYSQLSREGDSWVDSSLNHSLWQREVSPQDLLASCSPSGWRDPEGLTRYTGRRRRVSLLLERDRSSGSFLVAGTAVALPSHYRQDSTGREIRDGLHMALTGNTRNPAEVEEALQLVSLFLALADGELSSLDELTDPERFDRDEIPFPAPADLWESLVEWPSRGRSGSVTNVHAAEEGAGQFNLIQWLRTSRVPLEGESYLAVPVEASRQRPRPQSNTAGHGVPDTFYGSDHRSIPFEILRGLFAGLRALSTLFLHGRGSRPHASSPAQVPIRGSQERCLPVFQLPEGHCSRTLTPLLDAFAGRQLGQDFVALQSGVAWDPSLVRFVAKGTGTGPKNGVLLSAGASARP